MRPLEDGLGSARVDSEAGNGKHAPLNDDQKESIHEDD